MKRHIAGLACAAMTVLSVPALASTATAQTSDPISALRGQFKTGLGVKTVDTTKVRGLAGNAVVAKRTGVFQFGTSGIRASDHTAQLRIKPSDLGLNGETTTSDDDQLTKLFTGMTKPEQVVRIKNATYVSGGMFGEFLPVDKTWFRFDNTVGVLGAMSQFVNVAEPSTLKTLLGRATVKQAGTYAGKITFSELYKVSPWFRASIGGPLTSKDAKTSMSWKLYLGADKLAKRLTTSYPAGAKDAITVDTSYTGWGSKVTVAAPPADQVAKLTELEFDGKIEPPFTILNTIPN
ncbi:hypothetical protein [Streptosporangium lutulentum]|uniref:Uncharacterized protein n=1 Tax=Streptosporangium lutulentum TaxID=1461250 RepID=A0ABT9QJW1_9ACTN|nr:hypothetical protein [Streptosporangium lutulentum]MDP9846650.1 hypothetical protein [Streptosporangium lutulentum]